MDRSMIERSLRSVADPGRVSGSEMAADRFITCTFLRDQSFGVSAFSGRVSPDRAGAPALIAGLPALERLERALGTLPPERLPED